MGVGVGAGVGSTPTKMLDGEGTEVGVSVGVIEGTHVGVSVCALERTKVVGFSVGTVGAFVGGDGKLVGARVGDCEGVALGADECSISSLYLFFSCTRSFVYRASSTVLPVIL